MKLDTAKFVFGRKAELEELRRRILARTSFLVHGDSGAGKTFLLNLVAPQNPELLYCPDSSTGHSIFFTLAHGLLKAQALRMRRACGRAGAESLKSISTVSLRGLVMDTLREGNYLVVLDHLRPMSAGLAADTREIFYRGHTPLAVAARSPDQEELGFLNSFFRLRSDQMFIRPFAPTLAREFAELVAGRIGFCAENRSEFLGKVVQSSGGLPGSIVALIEMALLPKYRTADHVKFAPLYIDFRLAWHAANAR